MLHILHSNSPVTPFPHYYLHLQPDAEMHWGFGWWRSPVAHLHGVQEVAGSNPVHPTGSAKAFKGSGHFCKDFSAAVFGKIGQ